MISTEVRKQEGDRVWLWYVHTCENKECDQPVTRWILKRFAERSERYHRLYLHVNPRPKKVPDAAKKLQASNGKED